MSMPGVARLTRLPRAPRKEQAGRLGAKPMTPAEENGRHRERVHGGSTFNVDHSTPLAPNPRTTSATVTRTRRIPTRHNMMHVYAYAPFRVVGLCVGAGFEYEGRCRRSWCAVKVVG